ncbi:hypothetical protein HELRODRAFT_177675 [Helobdella robusta]|uniref:Protein quiver n=1 Tax=Helobdella robusta TaxID=6412 RepID=T1FC21_HELRO|nr:hypothetical protein HELRODRAFT_177675 [Helobdella robusta]ESN98002.1 hypothetical protein HELRODRAFT_177675 [Helobdella robusta]
MSLLLLLLLLLLRTSLLNLLLLSLLLLISLFSMTIETKPRSVTCFQCFQWQTNCKVANGTGRVCSGRKCAVLKYKIGGESFVERHCLNEDAWRECSNETFNNVGNRSVGCSCSTDFCNGH